MSMKTSNGTSSYASDSEHSDLDSKSSSSVSTVDDDLRGSNETEAFTESNGIKPSALVESLCDIPMFTDSLETVRKYKVGRMTIDRVRQVSDLANPVSYKYIEKADKMAAASVQLLRSQIPILEKPTGEIIQTVREYHEQLGASFEDNVTTPGTRLVMIFDSQLTPLVDVIEDLLEKMIPDEGGKRDIQDDQQLAQLSQTLRVLNIASETRQRCVEKVKKQLTSTQSYTADQIKQLQASNQLLSRATETVNTLNQTLLEMVGNLRETIQNPDLTTSLSSALMNATDSISAYIKLNAENFPEYLQERLKPLVDFFGQRYSELANEIRTAEGSPLEKAKNILQLTSEFTLPALLASVSDLQEAIQSYKSSLNTSINNTTDAVMNQIHKTSQVLNVK